jgi:hypothetical protein
VSVRLALGNQDRQLQQLGQRRPSQVAQRRLGDRQVPTLDRPVKDRP